jgi:hypothetical protein
MARGEIRIESHGGARHLSRCTIGFPVSASAFVNLILLAA